MKETFKLLSNKIKKTAHKWDFIIPLLFVLLIGLTIQEAWRTSLPTLEHPSSINDKLRFDEGENSNALNDSLNDSSEVADDTNVNLDSVPEDKNPTVNIERPPKVDNTSDDSPRRDSDSKTDKVWVPAEYKTISHPEQGHNEQRLVKDAWSETVQTGEKYICDCGAEFPSHAAWAAQKEANGG